jgi:hypothetical protein
METLSLGQVARKAGVGVEPARFSVGCSALPFRNPGDAQFLCVRHERWNYVTVECDPSG